MGERRRSPRLPIVQNATYTLHSSEARLSRALSKDVSEGGVCLLSEDRLAQGTPLELDITLSHPTARLIRTEGRVGWQTPWARSSGASPMYLTGVQFTKVAPAYRTRLGQWFRDMQAPGTLSDNHEIQQQLANRVQSAAGSFPVQMTLLKTPTAKIVATAQYVPDQIITNEDIIKKGLRSSDGMIRRALGAVERRAAASTMSNADMMANVAMQILKEANCPPTQLDRIICSADPQDAIAPNVASVVQRQIGASCPAFDVQMSCAGWLCGVDLAARCLQTGEHRILVLASSQVGSRLTFHNLMHRAIFGDGTGGILLESADRGNILSIGLWTAGTHYDKIYVPYAWSQRPDTVPQEYANSFYMSSNQEDFFTTMDFYLLPFCERLWETAGVSKGDIDHFLLHQPSIPLFEYSLKALDVPREKVLDLFARYGNLVAAEMPIYLNEALRSGRIRQGELVFLLAYGAGFTMGGMVMRY